MTPFEKWFSSDWLKTLRNAADEGEALSNGRICDASWDRRAGYLVWVMMGRPDAAWVEQTKHLYDRTAAPADDTEDLLALPSDPEIEDLLAL